MNKPPIRVLLVDDYEAWRRHHTTTLSKQHGLQIIGEATNGLEAVQQAQALQPDLILLDIGLPTLNGIEAARRIREVSPASKILFVTENRSPDIAEAALNTGTGGYVVKSDAAGELLPAVTAVLEGKRYVSASLAADGFNDAPNQPTAGHSQPSMILTSKPQNAGIARHEVGFYSGNRQFLDHVAQFIGTALTAGNAAIMIATESHRESVLLELQAKGLDIEAAIEEGRYIALDAADALSTFVIDGMVDRVRFMESFGRLIVRATKAANGEHPRVAFFGEGTHLLWTQGNVHAAIQDEKLCNELTKIYDIDILCGYSVENVQGGMDGNLFQQICAEHSAVHSL